MAIDGVWGGVGGQRGPQRLGPGVPDLVAIQTARGVVQSIRSCWPIPSTHTHPTPAIIHTQPTTPHHHAPQAHAPAPPHPFRCAEAWTQCDHERKADQPCIREVHRPCVGVGAGCMSGRVWVCTCVSVFVCVCMSACGCVVCLGRDQEVSRGEN